MREYEALLKREAGWFHYTSPHRIVTVPDVDEVAGALAEVEGLVNSNRWHAVGFISYEAAPAFDKAFKVLQRGDFPLLWFGLYPEPQQVDLPSPIVEPTCPDWETTSTPEAYQFAIANIKENIALGRTYQVNYTMRLRTEYHDNGWEFFLHLAHSQNKYAAFIDTGRYAICSASPELFFSLDGELITGRPMKGTVRRGRTTREDREKADWLVNSTKNRAENVMIVDMIRNDFGRIAETGTVQVPELFAVEKYPTLFQMTSTVQAKTRSSVTGIISALFPCASITGAPKVSTMKIISELETTPRRVYTGSIGVISPNRKALFNVAIRTAIVDRQSHTAEYGVGGGIVWDSTSGDEFAEALLKSRVLTDRLQDFSLFETILWTPSGGYFLLEKHIARMQDSAGYFDFPFSIDEMHQYMENIAVEFSAPTRVKILLHKNGTLSSEAYPFLENSSILKVGLAKTPVQSSNVFLHHKTTRREMYDDLLSNSENLDEVLLFNENGELTEFTIGNLVLELEEEFITPPVACGLLAGTFRKQLLETRKIKERVIHVEDLSRAKNIFLINSLRKWVKVRFSVDPPADPSRGYPDRP